VLTPKGGKVAEIHQSHENVVGDRKQIFQANIPNKSTDPVESPVFTRSLNIFVLLNSNIFNNKCGRFCNDNIV